MPKNQTKVHTHVKQSTAKDLVLPDHLVVVNRDRYTKLKILISYSIILNIHTNIHINGSDINACIISPGCSCGDQV